jgi:hypothetical protein
MVPQQVQDTKNEPKTLQNQGLKPPSGVRKNDTKGFFNTLPNSRKFAFSWPPTSAQKPCSTVLLDHHLALHAQLFVVVDWTVHHVGARLLESHRKHSALSRV